MANGTISSSPKARPGRSIAQFFFGRPRPVRRSHRSQDAAWRHGSRNPYDLPKRTSLWRRTGFQLALFGVSFLLSANLIIFHQFFQIQRITVTGLERLSETDVRSKIQTALSRKRFYVIPGANYLAVRPASLARMLREDFSIEQAIISKQFPQDLLVHIQEKISTIIYGNSSGYVYL